MQNYLDPTSEAKITRVVETELIGKQVGTGSAEKAALGSSCQICACSSQANGRRGTGKNLSWLVPGACESAAVLQASLANTISPLASH